MLYPLSYEGLPADPSCVAGGAPSARAPASELAR